MATLRGSSNSYNIGNQPPTVLWTVVRGDTSGFRVYATDDNKDPLNIPDWDINMKIKRPNNVADLGVITDEATTVMALHPAADVNDGPGEFTVWLAAEESHNLETGDIFDIQLSDETRVWTVCQGAMRILEDVTD